MHMRLPNNDPGTLEQLICIEPEDVDPNTYQTVDLAPDGSVYQDAVFMPLVQCTDMSGVWTPKASVYCKVVWLLILNVGLQTVMAFKMLGVTQNTVKSFKHDVIRLCQGVTAAGMPWTDSNISLDAKREYYDCGPLMVNVMSSVGSVDLNKDGKWSFDEASKLQEKYNGARVGRFEHVFYGTNFFIDPTKDVGRNIDMAWLRKKQLEIKLCGIVDPNMCSNMEVAGLLARTFPSVRGKEVRIEACAELFEDHQLCRSMFGPRLEFYLKHREDICGSPSLQWDTLNGINIASYEAVHKWTTDPDAIFSAYFISFMMLIMLVWFMLMMSELHQVVRWFIVVVSIETVSTESWFPRKRLLRDSIPAEFSVMPTFHRNFVVSMVWLPRFVVFVLTTYVGTIFLGAANNYIDLLLNATALGFLIEIDQMLHWACTDDQSRQQVANCKPLVVISKNKILRLHQRAFTWMYSFSLLAASAAVVGYINLGYTGNERLSQAVLCLCGHQGPACLGSALLA